MSSQSPIIIIGAGLSGLTLAHGLINARIPFLLFERDAALNTRAQGYRVRVNSIGQNALQQTLSPKLFSLVVATCAYTTSSGPNPATPGANLDGITGLKSDGFKQPPGQKSPLIQPDGVIPLNVDRSVLRGVLLQGLEAHVVWGKEFESYVTTPTSVTAKFKDGSKVEGWLLVGADGSWSRTRKHLVPEYVLLDTEGRLILGKTLLTPELISTFHEIALAGLTSIQGKAGAAPLTLLVEPIKFKENQYRTELPADYVY